MLSLWLSRAAVGRGRRWWAIMPRSASGLPSTTTREVLDREWEAEPDEEPVVG